MDIATFLMATLITHIGFAIFVTGHAMLTGREAGNWPYDGCSIVGRKHSLRRPYRLKRGEPNRFTGA